uniref:Uncharacterized protein n=1 Tax=Megaselia scalaris TaxID=36166 RepID=T1GZL4_MEGSC
MFRVFIFVSLNNKAFPCRKHLIAGKELEAVTTNLMFIRVIRYNFGGFLVWQGFDSSSLEGASYADKLEIGILDIGTLKTSKNLMNECKSIDNPCILVQRQAM